jgi:hypothetical protein
LPPQSPTVRLFFSLIAIRLAPALSGTEAPLATIPFRIRTYEKRARKPCRIRTYEKTPGGPPTRRPAFFAQHPSRTVSPVTARLGVRCSPRPGRSASALSLFPFDLQLSTFNLLPSFRLTSRCANRPPLLHCLSHRGSHLELFRHPQPSGRARCVFPKFSVSLTNHKTKAS